MQRPRKDGLDPQACPSHVTSDAVPRRAPKQRRTARHGPNAWGRRRQHIDYLASLLLGLVLVIVFFLPGQEHLHALGLRKSSIDIGQDVWTIKSKYYAYFWMIRPVRLSVFVVVLMAYHLVIAFYYSKVRSSITAPAGLLRGGYSGRLSLLA